MLKQKHRIRNLLFALLLFILWAGASFLAARNMDYPRISWTQALCLPGAWFAIGMLLSSLYVPRQKKGVRAAAALVGLVLVALFWLFWLQFLFHFSVTSLSLLGRIVEKMGRLILRSSDCPYLFALLGAIPGVALAEGAPSGAKSSKAVPSALALLLFLAAAVDFYYSVVLLSGAVWRQTHLSLHPLFYVVTLLCRPAAYGCLGCLLAHGLFSFRSRPLFLLCRTAGCLLTALYACALVVFFIYYCFAPSSQASPLIQIVSFIMRHPAPLLLPGALLGVGRGEVSPAGERAAL